MLTCLTRCVTSAFANQCRFQPLRAGRSRLLHEYKMQSRFAPVGKNFDLFNRSLVVIQRRLIFIRSVETPNEHAIVFLTKKLLVEKPLEVRKKEDLAHVSHTSSRGMLIDLLSIEGVKELFFNKDAVTVTKLESTDWQHIKPEIYHTITEYIHAHQSNGPFLQIADSTLKNEDTDDTLTRTIRNIVEERIRPAVQQDGGDVTFVSFDKGTGTVVLSMMGACRSCASSEVTLKNGIESMLRHYVPEVVRVVKDDF